MDYCMASSKTLTSGPGATEERIVDGALAEQRITPGTPWNIKKEYGSLRRSTEHYGAVQSIMEHLFLYDLFFITKLSINK